MLARGQSLRSGLERWPLSLQGFTIEAVVNMSGRPHRHGCSYIGTPVGTMIHNRLFEVNIRTLGFWKLSYAHPEFTLAPWYHGAQRGKYRRRSFFDCWPCWFLRVLVLGRCWILVRSVLWALVLYMVQNWYVLGCRLGAHTKGPQENLGWFIGLITLLAVDSTNGRTWSPRILYRALNKDPSILGFRTSCITCPLWGLEARGRKLSI